MAHRALGLIVLALAVIKAAWLAVSPTPPPLPTLKPWQRIASQWVHALLLVSIFLIPVTGYVISTAEGDAVPVFDWFEVPTLFAVSEPARDLAIEIHFYAAYALVAVALAHAGAAFKQHFVDRDATLKRML